MYASPCLDQGVSRRGDRVRPRRYRTRTERRGAGSVRRGRRRSTDRHEPARVPPGGSPAHAGGDDGSPAGQRVHDREARPEKTDLPDALVPGRGICRLHRDVAAHPGQNAAFRARRRA